MISALAELIAARSLTLDAAHGSLMAFTDSEAQVSLTKISSAEQKPRDKDIPSS